MSPVYEKKVYSLEQVQDLLKQAQCSEINIFYDHHEIIANLCYTVINISKNTTKEEPMK